MKTFATILAASSLLTLGAAAQVAFTPTSKNVKIDKIAPGVTSSPEYSFSKATDKRSTPMKWLEVEVEFEVSDLPPNVVIDDLTFEYVVEINGKLCPGEITHVNIAKGKTLYSIMYMSPRSIARVNDGKDLTPAALGNMWVKIKKQGALLAEKSLKAGPVPNRAQTTGLLVPKAETPFAPLWFDRYEAVKSR